MPSVLNPLFISKTLKSYLFDVDKLRQMDVESLKKHQDKKIKKIFKFAYKVPFYKRKCEEINLKLEDIKGTQDITKLPITTKKDLKDNFPDNIIPPKFNKEQAILMFTSGATGSPVGVFSDINIGVQHQLEYLTCLKEHDINWRKDKIVFLSNFSEVSSKQNVGNVISISDINPNLKSFFSFDNIRIVYSKDDPKKFMKDIEKLKPDLLYGYPNDLKLLAFLKTRGYGENIKPKCLATVGYVLDNYKKKIIEDAFDAAVFDIYGSTETGIIAFQCKYGNYHTLSDKCLLESLDGRSVVTKFYTGATPIIRYSGLEDIIVLSDEECDCGLIGTGIKKILGRQNQSINLANGKIFYPYDIENMMSQIMYEMHTNKIYWFQMIQRNQKEIEILIVIDKELKDKDPSTDLLFSRIKNKYQELFGTDIEIKIKEVDKTNDKPYIISYVK